MKRFRCRVFWNCLFVEIAIWEIFLYCGLLNCSCVSFLLLDDLFCTCSLCKFSAMVELMHGAVARMEDAEDSETEGAYSETEVY